MKFKFALQSLFSLICLLLVGCSGVRGLGSVGSTKFYAVRARSFDGPNITALVTQDTNTNRVEIQTAASGPGIGHTAIAAAGNVGSSAVFGLKLRPSKTLVSNGSNSGSAAIAGAGASSSSSASSASSAAGGTNTPGPVNGPVGGGNPHTPSNPTGNPHTPGNPHGNPHLP